MQRLSLSRRMKRFANPLFWALLSFLLCVAALYESHINGDGVEYLLMSHALAAHGSAAISSADVWDIVSQLSRHGDMSALNLLAQVPERLKSLPDAWPFFGFSRASSGLFYAIHFWMYSLLAAPFYAVLSALGAKPTWAFSLLNLALVGATLVYIRRVFPNVAREAALLFLALGTVYYLRWTGPEVMSACCVFVASVCILRRDTAAAIFLCGLGATQNPSIALMIPLALAHRLALRWQPSLAPLPNLTRDRKNEFFWGALGVALAIAPYVFFKANFGVPSITAKHFTDLNLISARRLISMLFDLDQGMIIGIPGLFAAAILLPFLVRRDDQQTFILNCLFFVACSVVLALPTLAAINWNSDASVILRYAYWAAMPAIAYTVSVLPRLEQRGKTTLLIAVLVGQACGVVGAGLIRRGTSYLQHTPVAQWALEHAGGYYSPDVEILFERGRHTEDAIDRHATHVVYNKGQPVKLARHWSNVDDTGGICRSDQSINSSSVAEVDGGWQYLHAPFTCEDHIAESQPATWGFGSSWAKAGLLLGGWSGAQSGGTWTIGKRSTVLVNVPSGRKPEGFRIMGSYFLHGRTSIVTVNGISLGPVSLADAAIDLPPALSDASRLTIEVAHPWATSPATLGASADSRERAYFIEAFSLRTVPK